MFLSTYNLHKNDMLLKRNDTKKQIPLELSKKNFYFYAETRPNKRLSVKRRIRLAEKRRLINRSRKSIVATFMKKAYNALHHCSSLDSLDTVEISTLEQALSASYSKIDKAVSKGVMHRNTGNRRKSKIAKSKKKLMIQSGLYQPLA